MGMCDQGRIQAGDPLAQALDPKLRGRIDDKVTFRCFDQKGCSGALISGVWGTADLTVTPDDGNTLGSSCAEKGEIQERHNDKVKWLKMLQKVKR